MNSRTGSLCAASVDSVPVAVSHSRMARRRVGFLAVIHLLGVSVLAGCIIPTKLNYLPSKNYYHADCVCSSCATALTPQGTCPQLGPEFMSNTIGCALADVDGEKSFEVDAEAGCKMNNVMGKFDCHLVELEPADTARSKYVRIDAEKSCDKDTSGLTATTSDDARIAISVPDSWISVHHPTGSFKAGVSGDVTFRGGNCAGNDCPLQLTALHLTTPDSVVFVHSDGKKTKIDRPAVVIPKSIDAVTSKRLTQLKAGYEFSFPKGALNILASGGVDGRRLLIKATNQAETASGTLLQDGAFLFDASAAVEDFKIEMHLVGRVRIWPPFLRVDRARFERTRRGDVLDMKLTYAALAGKAAPLLRLLGENVSISLRPKNGVVRVPLARSSRWYAIRACSQDVCVERAIDVPGVEEKSRAAE